MPENFLTATPFIPARLSLPTLREAAARCRGCDLWERGTQTVFGEGSSHARILMVGEQPGDKEDLMGRPFVGPAGAVLDKALQQAGIARDEVYVTNIVKHFKWEPRGKRRIHKKPSALEISACRPWLEAELAVTRPEVLVLLGATAAQGILGRNFRVTQHRGEWLAADAASPMRPVSARWGALAPHVLATVHPSAILRAPDDESRHEEMRRFVADLKVVAARIKQLQGKRAA